MSHKTMQPIVSPLGCSSQIYVSRLIHNEYLVVTSTLAHICNSLTCAVCICTPHTCTPHTHTPCRWWTAYLTCVCGCHRAKWTTVQDWSLVLPPSPCEWSAHHALDEGTRRSETREEKGGGERGKGREREGWGEKERREGGRDYHHYVCLVFSCITEHKRGIGKEREREGKSFCNCLQLGLFCFRITLFLREFVPSLPSFFLHAGSKRGHSPSA